MAVRAKDEAGKAEAGKAMAVGYLRIHTRHANLIKFDGEEQASQVFEARVDGVPMLFAFDSINIGRTSLRFRRVVETEDGDFVEK